MKIRLRSTRILTKEAKSLRSLLKKNNHPRPNIDVIQNELAKILGYTNFAQFIKENKFDGKNYEKLSVVKKRELLFRSVKVIKKAFGEFAGQYKGLHFILSDINPENDIFGNMTALSSTDYCHICPPIGAEELDSSIIEGGVFDEEIAEKSLYSQLQPASSTQLPEVYYAEALDFLRSQVAESVIQNIYERHGRSVRIEILALYEIACKHGLAEYKRDLGMLRKKDRVLWLALQCYQSSHAFAECLYLVMYLRGYKDVQTSTKILKSDASASKEIIICDNAPVIDKFSEAKEWAGIEEDSIWIGYQYPQRGGLFNSFSSKYKHFSTPLSHLPYGCIISGNAGSGVMRVSFSYLHGLIGSGQGGLIVSDDHLAHFMIKTLANSLGRANDVVLLSTKEVRDSKSGYVSLFTEPRNPHLVRDEIINLLVKDFEQDEIVNLSIEFIKIAIQSWSYNEKKISFKQVREKLEKYPFDIDALPLLKEFINRFGDNDIARRQKLSWITSTIVTALEVLSDQTKCGYCDIDNFSFEEAIEQNKIVIVISDFLERERSKFPAIMVKTYFEKLDDYHTQRLKFDNDAEGLYGNAPFILLHNYFDIEPDYLQKNFEHLRYKCRLTPIVVMSCLERWQSRVEGSVSKLWQYMGMRFLGKTEDPNYGIAEIDALDKRVVRGMGPGELIWLSNDAKQIRASYVDIDAEVFKSCRPIDVSAYGERSLDLSVVFAGCDEAANTRVKR